MERRTRAVFTAQILLTLTAFEFFGPIVRDFNASHALNPSWVGHARLHLVWLLGFMLLSGIANLYLVWFRRPFDVRNLWLSAAWQCCNLGGFWMGALLAPAYGGVVTVPGEHVHIFGWDENVVVFTILSALMVAALVLLRRASVREAGDAAR
jgi:hypothetical protein